ncbi:selenium-binding protein [Brevibacillus sp. FSL K6-0770]|uniref:selenium-binding protein n=1 Tax=Brevibacillus sp. FSL K6-0770 TaxID=2954673 RepID=UPI0030FC3DE4
MGIFAAKKDSESKTDMLVITSDKLNRDYEPIGTVSVASAKISSDLDVFINMLAEKAKEQGADAVICFRYHLSGAVHIAYGTAVKFK